MHLGWGSAQLAGMNVSSWAGEGEKHNPHPLWVSVGKNPVCPSPFPPPLRVCWFGMYLRMRFRGSAPSGTLALVTASQSLSERGNLLCIGAVQIIVVNLKIYPENLT